MEALYKKLKTLLYERFPDWLRSQEFAIQRKDETEDDWVLKFESRKSTSRTNGDDLKVAVCITQGDEKHEYGTHLKLVSDDGIQLQIRGDGQGKWKTFKLTHLSEPVDDGWHLNNSTADLTYNQRRFSQNILRVWFPQENDSRSSALQIPVRMNRKTGEDWDDQFWDTWARFTSEGVEVSLPSDTTVGFEEDGFPITTIDDDWMPVWLSYLAYWLVCNVYATKGILRSENGKPPEGFPDIDKYKAHRAVNLNPATVIERLEDNELYFPWHVVESACSALNAGKHVIFTGPPGCGKSKLSVFLAKEATGEAPLISTASPAWTSGDLLGRYLPDRSGNGLKFQEGFFLRALGQGTQGKNQRSRWLIIDEFNRADIDACFGELFSVLADDSVELPFRQEVASGENETQTASEPVRIIPGDQEAETDADYLVPEEFRLIGTMNDADRSGLNNLSFALMRRFAIIPVEAPSKTHVKQIIKNSISKTTRKDLNLEAYGWNVSLKGTRRCQLDQIEDELVELFARKGDSSASFENLVSEGVVGVAVIGDIIRFVGEGLRAETESEDVRRSDGLKERWGKGLDERAKGLTLSYLALAVVLQVYPQLEALGSSSSREENRLLKAIRHIFTAIHQEGNALPMVRVAKVENGYQLQSDLQIGEFLYRNLQTRFPHQAPGWKDELDPWLDGASDE